MGWRGRRDGGSGWGTRVNPWLIHVNVWQKPLQYCKVISLQLIKINGKGKKKKHDTVGASIKKKKNHSHPAQPSREMRGSERQREGRGESWKQEGGGPK